MIKDKGLYIHIPFCKHICSYCDFNKRIKKNDEQETIYINRLLEELNFYKKELKYIKTIYIGGGTPNHLSDYNLERLLKYIKQLHLRKVVEYTIEINVELLTVNQVRLFKKYNINRVSLGVQTFNQKHLKLLNRHHNRKMVEDAITLLNKFDINNISVDLMYGFFNQKLKEVVNDLYILLKLNITHISAYSFILEEKTKLYIEYQKNMHNEIDDDLVSQMYLAIHNILKKHQFNKYEVSNYAKPNYKSVHNKIYWRYHDYIGVGLGAVGFIDGTRYTNNKNLDLYLTEFINNKEVLDLKTKKSEYIIMNLRLVQGINRKEYKTLFGNDITKDYNLDEYVNNKLLKLNKRRLAFTTKGMLVSNLVLHEFV